VGLLLGKASLIKIGGDLSGLHIPDDVEHPFR
jgi:hypothetical protein